MRGAKGRGICNVKTFANWPRHFDEGVEIKIKVTQRVAGAEAEGGQSIKCLYSTVLSAGWLGKVSLRNSLKKPLKTLSEIASNSFSIDFGCCQLVFSGDNYE